MKNYAFGPFQAEQQKQVDAICNGANELWGTITTTLGTNNPQLPEIRNDLDDLVYRSVGTITTTGATHGARG